MTCVSTSHFTTAFLCPGDMKRFCMWSWISSWIDGASVSSGELKFWKYIGKLNLKDKVCDFSATSTTKWTCLSKRSDWEHHWLYQCHEFRAILPVWSNNGSRGSVYNLYCFVTQKWHISRKYRDQSIHAPCTQLTQWNHNDFTTRTLDTLLGGIATYSQLVRQRWYQIPQNTLFFVFRLLLWRTRREN